MWSNIFLFQKSVWFQHTDINSSSIQDVINHLSILAVLLRKKVNLVIVLSVLRFTASGYPVGVFQHFFNLFFFQTYTTPCSCSERQDILCNIFWKGSCSSVVYEELRLLTLHEHMSTLGVRVSHRFSFQSCVFLLLLFCFLVFVLCFMTNVDCVSGLSILIASSVFSK